MKRRLFASFLSLLAAASVGLAQEEIAPPRTSVTVMESSTPVVPYQAWGMPLANGSRFTASAEYLNWWITPGPVGAPLITTGDPNSPNAGAIGDPSTRVLFGNSNVDYGSFSGGRVNLGYWFCPDQVLGVTASGFALGQRSNTFAINSTDGVPLLRAPFQDGAGDEGVRALTIGIPGSATNITIRSTSQLWGADFNAALNVHRQGNLSIDLLAGVRYYDLFETLQSNVNLTINIPGNLPIDVKAAALDRFTTRNQFYGSQLGARGSYQAGRLSIDALGLVALGTTHRTLVTSGSTDVNVNGMTDSNPGGLYTTPSNIGTSHSNSFSAIPQMQIKVGYDITRNLRATVGYDAMYWSNVIRPGNQIDHVHNFTDRPAVMNNQSGLWAHGVSTGLEFRW